MYFICLISSRKIQNWTILFPFPTSPQLSLCSNSHLWDFCLNMYSKYTTDTLRLSLKSHTVGLEPPGCLLCLRGVWVQMERLGCAESSHVAQRVESGPRSCSADCSSQKQPGLVGSPEFSRASQGSPRMRNAWAPMVPETPGSRLDCKESGSRHLSRKSQSLYTLCSPTESVPLYLVPGAQPGVALRSWMVLVM